MRLMVADDLELLVVVGVRVAHGNAHRWLVVHGCLLRPLCISALLDDDSVSWASSAVLAAFLGLLHSNDALRSVCNVHTARVTQHSACETARFCKIRIFDFYLSATALDAGCRVNVKGHILCVQRDANQRKQPRDKCTRRFVAEAAHEQLQRLQKGRALRQRLRLPLTPVVLMIHRGSRAVRNHERGCWL